MSSLTVKLTDIMKKCLTNVNEQHWNYVNISCLQKHCLITCDDVVIFCQQIPLTDQIRRIHCEDFNNRDCFVIILTTNASGCVLSLKEKKVIECFQENVQDIFIDDYICNGHEQLVCVFNDQDGDDNYYITDYDCCIYDTRTDNQSEDMFVEKSTSETNEEDNCSEGYNAALSALNSKILSTTSLLHDENAKRLEKEKLLQTSIGRLVNQSLGKDQAVDFLPGLLDLFGEKASTSEHEDITSSRPFTVHNIWYKVHSNEIIFVAEIENTTKEDHFYNISLQLVSNCADCLSSRSDVLFFNKKLEKVESAMKHQKLELYSNSMYPGRKCNLISSANIPDIPFESGLDFELYISYCDKNHQFFSVYIGEQSITIKDLTSDCKLLSEKFSLRDSKSNLVFNFLNCQDSFTLSSQTSSLVLIPKLISDRLNCKSSVFGNTVVIKTEFLDSEIVFTNTGSLLDCSVHSRKRKTLELISSEIKKNLPADVRCGKKFDVVKIVIKQFYELLEKEINETIDYYGNCIQQIEMENEKNQNVIIIDSPKRKRSEDGSNLEELHQKYVESVLNTDEFLIANADLMLL